MRYFILFFILIEMVYASSGFCFIIPKEMTKLKNEDDDFAFYLQRVGENNVRWKGEVGLVLTILPKETGKWEKPDPVINVFHEKEFIIRARVLYELEEYDHANTIGKRPEGAFRFYIMINPKYLEHSYLAISLTPKIYNPAYTTKTEKIGEIETTIYTWNSLSTGAKHYKLKFKDFIKIETLNE